MRGFGRFPVVGGLILLGWSAGCVSSQDDSGTAAQAGGGAPPAAPAAPAADAVAQPPSPAPAATPADGAPAPALAKRASPVVPAFDRDAPTTRSRFGRLSAPVGTPDERAARAFLAENAGDLGIESMLEDVALERPIESPMGVHYVFQQTYDGVPVQGAELSVHFNRDGEVVASHSSYVAGIALETTVPAIPGPLAVDVVRGAVPPIAEDDTGGAATSDLCVYTGSGGAALAWRVAVPTDGASWEAYVSAADGTFLSAPRDTNHYVNGTGKIFNVNAVVATQNNGLRDNNDAASAVPASAYTTVTLERLVGNGRLDGQFASTSATKKRVSSSTHKFEFLRNSDGFSETMAYWAIDYSQKYIQELGFTNVNNRRQVINVAVNNQDNSFYSPKNKRISFGEGGVDDAEDAEVIWHEYGHSIQDDQVPNFGTSAQGGAMGEGFGDYFAGTIGAQLSGGFQDLFLMEWDATSYSNETPPRLRTLVSTKHFPEDFVNQVHADGEMWSAALWQIRDAIGASKADRVILQSHFLLSANANFAQGSNALVTAAINLGYSAAEVDAIRTILQNRGFTVTA